MKLNMKVLKSEDFRALEHDVQIVYIYSSLFADDNGLLEDFGELEGCLFTDVLKTLGTLELHGLVSYNGEYDSLKIIKEQTK